MCKIITEVPRRTISELQFLYEHHPDRRDVYVEGISDATIITWIMNEIGIDVVVYPISSIEIPNSALIAMNLTPGNQNRVICLSEVIKGTKSYRAACIIDADFALLRGKHIPSAPLFRTDYSCMEMYSFCKTNFQKFINLNCQKYDWPIDKIISALADTLQELFLIRFANDELELGLDWLDKVTAVTIDEWDIKFDRNMFISKLLNKNSQFADLDNLNDSIIKLRVNLNSDSRYQINGHDFIALFAWYLRKKSVSSSCCSRELVFTGMLMTLDINFIQNEPMFSSLIARLS